MGSTTAGVIGPVGPAGAAGPQGPAGAKGPTGPAGVVPCWVSYREFWFTSGSADILDTQKSMIADMADYVKRNPSLILGIDGYMDSRHLDLSKGRVDAVRDSLINNGVPADRIKVGDFGEPKLRRDGRVEVLIKTGLN